MRVRVRANPNPKPNPNPNPCGRRGADEARFNEPGYIATPPCLWGSREHGLETPPLMNGVTIRVVALTNTSYGHHGEMALPEVTLGPAP